MKVKQIVLLLSLMTFTVSFAQDDVALSCPDDNHPHAIDLGLPTGTKWACCNVGATKPYERGGCYACYGYSYFGYHGQDPKEILVYDFDWDVGKDIPVYYTSGKMVNSTVTEIGQVEMIDWNVYDCIYQSGGNDLLQVKGIGNLGNYGGLLRPLMDFPWDGSTLRYKRVLNFTRNGRLIYQWNRDDFLEEKLDIKMAKREASKKDGAIYTCDGRRISQGADTHRLPKGVYIQNGRKYIVK